MAHTKYYLHVLCVTGTAAAAAATADHGYIALNALFYKSPFTFL